MKKKKISTIDFSAQQWFNNAIQTSIIKTVKFSLGTTEYILLHQNANLNRISAVVTFDKDTSYARSTWMGIIGTGRVTPSGGLTGYSDNIDIKLYSVVYQGVTYAAVKKPDAMSFGQAHFFFVNNIGANLRVVLPGDLTNIQAL